VWWREQEELEGVKWGSTYPVKGMGDLETEEIIDADKGVV
jgi:hypothetical protein